MTISRASTRYGYLVAGWFLVIWGFISYPVPLYPSTVTIVAGLLLIAKVQPWARRLILVARRRIRPFNRLYLKGIRLVRQRQAARADRRQPGLAADGATLDAQPATVTVLR